MAKLVGVKGVADILVGTAGSDEIIGNDMDDDLRGGGGLDLILGGTGNDVIRGESGADTLYGGQGDDLIVGGAGADYMSGDAGSDTLIGGQGNDHFVFDVRAGVLGNGIDTVTDFALGADHLTIVSGNVANVTFTQDGADLDVYYNGIQIATLLTEVYTGNNNDYFGLA